MGAKKLRRLAESAKTWEDKEFKCGYCEAQRAAGRDALCVCFQPLPVGVPDESAKVLIVALPPRP